MCGSGSVELSLNAFIVVVGGFSFFLMLIRLLFIYIVHNFIQGLRRVSAPWVMCGMGAMAYTSSQHQYQQQQQPYHISINKSKRISLSSTNTIHNQDKEYGNEILEIKFFTKKYCLLIENKHSNTNNVYNVMSYFILINP